MFFTNQSESMNAQNKRAIKIFLSLKLNYKSFTHQEFVIHSFDNDLLGRVLRNVEAQLQHLVVTLVLDEGTVEAIQPSVIMLRTQGTAILSALLRGSAVISNENFDYRQRSSLVCKI